MVQRDLAGPQVPLEFRIGCLVRTFGLFDPFIVFLDQLFLPGPLGCLDGFPQVLDGVFLGSFFHFYLIGFTCPGIRGGGRPMDPVWIGQRIRILGRSGLLVSQDLLQIGHQVLGDEPVQERPVPVSVLGREHVSGGRDFPGLQQAIWSFGFFPVQLDYGGPFFPRPHFP